MSVRVGDHDWHPEDLDRCEHGLHSTAPCLACPGGQSTGNLFLENGQRIGTTITGEPIYVDTNRPPRSLE